MSDLKIAIIEDEFIVAEDLKLTLEAQGYQVSAIFAKAEKALTQLPELRPDLLLIDIRLQGEMSGIELADSIKKTQNIPIIYITANSDNNTYNKAKETGPVAFLVKPFNTPTLLATIDLAFHHYENLHRDRLLIQNSSGDGLRTILNDAVFLKTNGKYKKIPFYDLLLIEADGSYLTLITTAHKFKLTHNLSDFQRRVQQKFFCRTHRSYIVNLERVESFDDNFIYIGDHKIPLSKSYRADFTSKLKFI